MSRKKHKKNGEKDLDLLLKQVGEKSGLSLEEMKRRYTEFLSQTATPSISEEELEKKTKEFLETLSAGKRKVPKIALKVTVTLNEEEAKKFYTIKKAMGVKSNAAVLRELLHSHECTQKRREMREMSPPYHGSSKPMYLPRKDR